MAVGERGEDLGVECLQRRPLSLPALLVRAGHSTPRQAASISLPLIRLALSPALFQRCGESNPMPIPDPPAQIQSPTARRHSAVRKTKRLLQMLCGKMEMPSQLPAGVADMGVKTPHLVQPVPAITAWRWSAQLSPVQTGES